MDTKKKSTLEMEWNFIATNYGRSRAKLLTPEGVISDSTYLAPLVYEERSDDDLRLPSANWFAKQRASAEDTF